MKEELRQSLSRRHKQSIVDTSRVASAVLVPVYQREGQFHIVFTKRTSTVSTHKGQISFPGGAYDPEDKTLLNTALREADEEIGLMTGDVEVLGELDDKYSVATNYVISPFVGLIPWPYDFKLNKAETERLIEPPIAALLENGCLHMEDPAMVAKGIIGFFYVYKDDIIWGATARILNQFLDIYARMLRENRLA